jgi:N-methylhydantoinase B/oxoprolinase/acetone carboxylase alpha subunit
VDRDPEAVRWDVINGKISMASARKNYKVVFDTQMNVDMEATKELRFKTT